MFWKYANYSGISPDRHTERDENIKLMKEKIAPLMTPDNLVREKKLFQGQGEEEAFSCETDCYYELVWNDIKAHFKNSKHFLLCLSLYFDWMPKIQTDHESSSEEKSLSAGENSETRPNPVKGLTPKGAVKYTGEKFYPLRVKPDWFGHQNGAFYILSQAELFNTNDNQHRRSLYITTLDDEFIGSRNKRKKSKKGFNFDAYEENCISLHAHKKKEEYTEFMKNQKSLASCLINTLEGRLQKPDYERDKAKAMLMGLVIPFVTKPDNAKVIKGIYSDLEKDKLECSKKTVCEHLRQAFKTRIKPDQQVKCDTEHDIELMEQIWSEQLMKLVKEKKLFQEDTYFYETDRYYELDWADVKDRFDNPEHFLLCLSQYCHWMPKIQTDQDSSSEEKSLSAGENPETRPNPEDGQTPKEKEENTRERFYPLRVKVDWFGTEDEFYVAQLTLMDPQACKRDESLCVIRPKATNFDAYKDLCSLLHGKEGDKKAMEGQKEIASYLLNTLDGTQEPLQNPPYEMDVIRAMVMILAIPFIAEIAPPPDDSIEKIRNIYADLIENRLDRLATTKMEKQLKALGGRNPGCHEKCYELLKAVQEGDKTFRMVFRHPSQTTAAFVPSGTGGVLEYRISMFSVDKEIDRKLTAKMNMVSIKSTVNQQMFAAKNVCRSKHFAAINVRVFERHWGLIQHVLLRGNL